MVQDPSGSDSSSRAGGQGTGSASGTGSDDLLAGLRRLAGLAKDLGVSDVSSFTDLLEQARREGRGPDLFKSLKSLVDQFTTQGSGAGVGEGPSLGDLGERLSSWAASAGRDGGGREGDGDVGAKAESALLRRIEELSRTATIEGVVELAGAYAQVCNARGGSGGTAGEPVGSRTTSSPPP